MKIVVSAIALAGLMGLGVTTASAQNSPAYCDQYAKNYARQTAGGNAVAGAVIGGIGGAVLGGILGKGNKAVAPGAVAGAVGGGVIGGASWQKKYNQAYYQCINQPPQYQAPPPAYAPAVGTQAWKQACSQKYNSFDWNTGYYLGYDGDYHLCKIP